MALAENGDVGSLPREAEAEDTAAPSSPVSLRVHETIQVLQLENGLRFTDYRRYRRFCSRRLRRLRQSCGVPCAKGKQYTGGEVTAENARTQGHLLLVLLLAERAWAFAMDLKTEASGGEDWRRALDRRQFLRRLAKAQHWAALLRQLAEARGDARTQLETQCYAAWMAGHHALEQEYFQAALGHFTTARGLMVQLSRDGSVEDQDLFSKRLEALTPAVRWCAYNLGEPDPTANEDMHVDAADDSLASKLADATLRDSAAADSAGTTQLRWGGRSLPIVASENDGVKVDLLKAFQAEKELQTLLARPSADGAQSAQAVAARIGLVLAGEAADGAPGSAEEATDGAEVAAAEAKAFSGIFDAFDAAERALDREMHQLKTMTSGDRVDSSLAAATSLKACVAWRRMEHMLHRNLRLAVGIEARWEAGARLGRSASAADIDANPVEDLVHLYEIMRVLSQDMEELHSVKDHEELYQRALATQAVTRCYRCFFLGESYAKSGRLAEAHRLFTHCQTLTGDAIEAGRAAMDAIRDANEPEEATRAGAWEDAVRGMIQLELQCTGGRSRLFAQIFLRRQNGASAEDPAEGDEVAGTAKRGRDLMDRLDDFDDGGGRETLWRLQSVPPTLSALPGKPLFLDIASHYLQFPNLDAKAGVPAEQQGLGGKGGEGGAGWLSWLTG